MILKCASDFLGDALGVSEKTTQGILKSAEGCVLVIDEAYSLYSGGSTGSGSNDPYKTAVIDTIVEKVQAKPGADIAVVMIGYQKEMENMMSHVNPGLSRRFQIDDAFLFPDFSNEALLRRVQSSHSTLAPIRMIPNLIYFLYSSSQDHDGVCSEAWSSTQSWRC